jgi:hypothetical protein
MTTAKKMTRSDGIKQTYHVGRAPVVPREAVAKPPAADPAPLAPVRVDYASLVLSPGRAADSRVDKDQLYQWEYFSGFSLDRRTGATYWWRAHSSDNLKTFDEVNGHVINWSFPEPLAGDDKLKTFDAVREDLGRLVDGYYNEFDGHSLVARDANNGTDWESLYGRITEQFEEASSGANWADDRAVEEFEDAEERVTAAVDALARDGLKTELEFANDGGVYIELTDIRTGERVNEDIDSTNDKTIAQDLQRAVVALNEAVAERDADDAWEDDDE